MVAKHGRKLALGAVGLVPGRVRHDAPAAAEVREVVEAIMIRSGFLRDAPFEWVGLILRFGTQNADIPGIEAINSEGGDLPVSIELDMAELLKSSKDEIRKRFLEATLKALIHVGKKYTLPTTALEQALAGSGG